MRNNRLWQNLSAVLAILAVGVAGYFYWHDQQKREEDRIARMTFEDVWSAHEAGQYRSAFRGAQRLAGEGNTPAQVLLGRMYNQGVGTSVDYAQALNWYLRAADSEHPEAMFAVMSYYSDGRGLERPNPHGAAHWARRLAEMGDPRAQAYIGSAYIDGYGVAKNPERGREWLQQAAEAGDLEAMSRLARAYRAGAFGERDYERALHWYLASARFGDVMSIRAVIAILTYESRPVFDLEKAYFWALVGTEWAGERSIIPRYLALDIVKILYHVPDGFPPSLVDISGLTDTSASAGSSRSRASSWYEIPSEPSDSHGSTDPAPAAFDYESWPRRIDPEAQSRVEAEARDFLIRFPEPPMTM